MPLDDQYKMALTYYVKDALEKEVPRSDIKQELRDQGCDESEVQSVLRLGDDLSHLIGLDENAVRAVLVAVLAERSRGR